MYQVLARKWRPQSFPELVGQKHVTRTLTNAIDRDRLAHAYIFSGLRGTGKTTAARILAKCLNCEKGPTTTPCGECDACTEIAESRAIDVLEVDAASRTKVEQTRELLEMISYAPARDRFKILIIDEAHMLSKASFNALLKTLEEPPPNVLFVLATTEIQKILPTILSRCQVFEFRRVGPRELADHLARICETEEIEVSRATLERLARSGEGSVRDTLSLLERAMAFCGRQIEDDDILRMLGGVRAEVLASMVGALAARDAATMLTTLDGLVDEGHDLTHFWTELVSALRDLLLMYTLPDPDDLLARSPEEAASLRAAAQGLSLEDLSRAFHQLAELELALRGSSRPRYMFEAALIRLASLGAVRPIEELLSTFAGDAPPSAPRPQKKNAAAAVARAERPRKSGPSRATEAAQDAGRRPSIVADSAPAPDPAADPITGAQPRPTDAPGATPPDTGSLAGRLVEAVRGERPMVAAILEQASAVKVDGEEMCICFAGASAMSRQLERKSSIELLGRLARGLVGHEVRVVVSGEPDAGKTEAGDGAPPNAARPAPKPRPTADTSAAPSPPERPAAPRRLAAAPKVTASTSRSAENALLERATAEPGVSRLLREFGAQVVDIQPQEPNKQEKPPKRPARRTTGRRRPLEESP